ncbi:MAG TPA: M1 family aminopeptidase [Nitrosospira sp.]|nr:M1 family aminopeptidase [Nitrosospira sp.]
MNQFMILARLTYVKGMVGFLFSMLVVTAAFATSSATSGAPPGSAPGSAEVHYDITVRLDPVARKIEGRSVITANTPEELTLVIGRRFEVMRGRVDGSPFGPAATMGRMRGWRILGDEKLPRRIEIHWRGELAALDTALDHNQTLGRSDPASGEAGTFLPDSSGWYPYLADKLASYNLTIELPAGQRGIVPGRLAEETETAEGYRARFEFPAPTGGIDLMAGPYAVDTRTVRGAGGKPIQLRTYFHAPIADLAPAYLDSVKDYLGLYESWIGEYPFSEFSVVSSPTPTGFGMPTLTYLGVEVLRLPFIRATSLGHEVLHNWWGNGVYPDYAQGNWSEGLTTFMADYAYKERESADAARDMRRGWLRDFAALAPGQDKPLTTFTSRLHGATQIVGYNKAAMLFLMLRDMLGRETFDRALQTFWREQRFRVASWVDLRRAFETASGQDLGFFFNQWLTRAGAPVLRIADAALMKPSSGNHQVTITLEQAEPVYRLRVPVGIRTAESEELHVLDLERARQAFTVDVRNRPTEVILDPDLRLFRRLMPNEAPPILRQVMVDHTAETILLPESGEARSAAETLAAKMQNRAPKLAATADGSSLPAVPLLVIGLAEQVDAWLAKHRLPARPDVMKGKGSAQAWTVSRPDGVTLAMVSAQDLASLAALARPLPHYGRQSYVVFDGAKMISRGAWPTRSQAVKLE